VLERDRADLHGSEEMVAGMFDHGNSPWGGTDELVAGRRLSRYVVGGVIGGAMITAGRP
jgi:hypothetical protein